MALSDGVGASFLLVDDNEDFLRLIASFVRRYYPESRIDTATSGEQAISKLTTAPWDVVLLDYRLPDFDGLEVLAEIRKRLVDVAVVMVTGEGDERLAADIFRMGAYDYLVKSVIDPVALRRCLDQVLMRRVLETQIDEKSDELVASSRELSERTRALDTAYEKLKVKKEELRRLSDSLEATVQERTAELRATTRFLNQVLDSSTDHFIVATDSDGTILTFNKGAEAGFGLDAGEIVGSTHFRVLFKELADDDSALGEITTRCLNEGSAAMVLTGLASGGTEFLAEITVSRLPADDGEWGLVILGTDITHERELELQNQAYIRQIERANLDLRRKNEQILEATRLKSEFLANVSHELRTPLNAIIGYSDLLAGGIYGDLAPKQGTAVDGITTRARDLLTLINGILDLAKIEAGKMELRVGEFSLAAVVDEVTETGRVLAADKPVEVSWEHAGDDVVLVSDRQKLQQILLNLVNNAVKFTHEGHVRVTTRRHGAELVIQVEDSGIGIPASALSNVFDEFRQVDGTSTREFGGTGLGLAISHKFALQLGGEMTAFSTLGEGSRFRLTIPVEVPGTGEILLVKDGYVPVTLDPVAAIDMAAVTADPTAPEA